MAFNRDQPYTYWADFLILAKWFCYNTFPIALDKNYLSEIEGCGTDAVPLFAVWTNVVEIDENDKPLNSAHALKRANERIKQWDGVQPAQKFRKWEWEQEIY